MKHEQEPDVELRDVFAMQAMRVVPPPVVYMTQGGTERSKQEFAAACYKLADFMMAARSKK